MEAGYEDRGATEGDIPALIELLRRHETGDHGRVTADWDHIVPFVFRNPGFDPQEDGRIVDNARAPVGFTGVFREDAEGQEPYLSWIAADPAHADAVLAFLLDWDLARAAQRGARVLRHLAYRSDARHREALIARGFRRIRSTWTMHRSLADAPPAPPMPEGVRLATLAEHPDEHALYEAEQEAFREHFGFAPETFESWRRRHIGEDEAERDQWLLALDGDEIAALLREVSGGDVAQIAIVGTRPAWRGRGIATALLQTSFARMAAAGHREVTLWVDAENETGAVGLYESVGMRAIVVDDTYELDLVGGA